MNEVKIYFLEDDKTIANLVKDALNNYGYRVSLFYDYRIFFDAVKREKPSLIILDLSLPQINGKDILTYLKKNEKLMNIPVIVESGTSSEDVKVYCLDNGADDYLCKPYSIVELRSRVNAVLRRYQKPKPEAIKGISLNDDFTVIVNDKIVKLKNREFLLLEYLLANYGKLVLKQEILSMFWPNAKENSRSLDMHIAALREKIFKCSDYELKTILKKGYRLEIIKKE